MTITPIATYNIRRGVHFQNKPPVNGREMNAHDVAFDLHRAFYNPGAFLSLLYPPDKGKGDIRGEVNKQAPVSFWCHRDKKRGRGFESPPPR